jgi:hypothetical protein
VYPDERVERFVTQEFNPARVHAREQADQFRALGERFGAEWTPTLLVLDSDGQEHHRIEGFLPLDDLLGELMVGLGRMAFDAGDFDQAEQRFRAVVDEHPDSDAAPAGAYWAGVAKYKATNDPSALGETGRALQRDYPGSTWAKKGSVWLK